jgi:hypothetical protein
VTGGRHLEFQRLESGAPNVSQEADVLIMWSKCAATGESGINVDLEVTIKISAYSTYFGYHSQSWSRQDYRLRCLPVNCYVSF